MDASMIRASARRRLQGSWPNAIAVAVVACLLDAMISGSGFLPSFNPDPEQLRHYQDALERGIELGDLTIRYENGLLGLIQFLLGGTVQLGFAEFLLRLHDGEKPGLPLLFSQFHRFGQGFAQKFLRGLYTALWSLLFIIPGIVKSLSYAMTPFIMADRPELSASDAIRISMAMMEGHRLDLFWLHLTFFGWDILAALTGNLGYILLNPYTNMADAVFYRQLTDGSATVV